MQLRFNVTYEIVTPESAACGDIEELGFIAKNCTLRDAINRVFETRTSQCSGVECAEANESPVRAPRWVTVYNGVEYLTSAYESRSLHIPDTVTPSSARRLARLLGVH